MYALAQPRSHLAFSANRRKSQAPGTLQGDSFCATLTEYLNTFSAIPCATMLMSYGGQMRTGAAEALWKLAHEKPISETDTANMFFSDFWEQRGPTARTHERYYGASADSAPSTGRRATTSRVLISSSDDDGAPQARAGSQVILHCYCLCMLPASLHDRLTA